MMCVNSQRAAKKQVYLPVPLSHLPAGCKSFPEPGGREESVSITWRKAACQPETTTLEHYLREKEILSYRFFCHNRSITLTITLPHLGGGIYDMWS